MNVCGVTVMIDVLYPKWYLYFKFILGDTSPNLLWPRKMLIVSTYCILCSTMWQNSPVIAEKGTSGVHPLVAMSNGLNLMHRQNIAPRSINSKATVSFRTGVILGPDPPQRITNLLLAFENQPATRHAKTQVWSIPQSWFEGKKPRTNGEWYRTV